MLASGAGPSCSVVLLVTSGHISHVIVRSRRVVLRFLVGASELATQIPVLAPHASTR